MNIRFLVVVPPVFEVLWGFSVYFLFVEIGFLLFCLWDHWFFPMSPMSILLLSPSIEFFKFKLSYFSVPNLQFDSLSLLFLHWDFLFFLMCFKHVCNWSLKNFYDILKTFPDNSNIFVIMVLAFTDFLKLIFRSPKNRKYGKCLTWILSFYVIRV